MKSQWSMARAVNGIHGSFTHTGYDCGLQKLEINMKKILLNPIFSAQRCAYSPPFSLTPPPPPASNLFF